MNSNVDSYLELLKKHPQLSYDRQNGGLEIKTDEESRRNAEKISSKHVNNGNKPKQDTKTGIVAEDEYLLWLRDAVLFPNQQLGTYIRLFEKPLGKSGVAVLPIFGDNILLIRHFRHASGQWHWEIPRGYCDPNETIYETATRELAEEIGASISRIKELGQYHPNTGLLGSSITIVQAEVSAYDKVDTSECISELIEVSKASFKSMVANGEIDDGFTLSAFTYYLCSV